MNASDWIMVVAALVALVGIVSSIQWARLLRQSRIRSPRDPVIQVDQWTAERRRQLAQLNQPAPKGIAARRTSGGSR